MTIIAAITLNHGLGRSGDMLYHISADLKRFKALTMGYALVMGRKTFESFPNGPLPGRRNIVVTRNAEYSHPGIETYPTLEAALEAAGSDAFVIGGGEIYAQVMAAADTLEITEIEAVREDADTYFPEISPDKWEAVEVGEWLTDPRSGVGFRYVKYKRKGQMDA